MTNDESPIFVDTNVLVYANVSQAPLHRQALAAIQALWDSETGLWISRQILREYLATVTRPQTFAGPMPIPLAIARIRFFQTRCYIADDVPQVTEKLLSLLAEVPVGGKQIHDANIVATMLAYGIEHLLTHNPADFNRFSDYITVLPLVTDQD